MRGLINVLKDPRAVHNRIGSKISSLSFDAIAKMLVDDTTGPRQESRSDTVITTLGIEPPEPDSEGYSQSDKVHRTLPDAVIYKELVRLYSWDHYEEE